MLGVGRKLKESSLSNRAISFIDKILVIDISRLFFVMIFWYSLVYTLKISGGEYVWVTKVSLLDLGFLFLSLIFWSFIVYFSSKFTVFYTKIGFILLIIFNCFISFISSFTLTISYSALYLSYSLFLSSILILYLYCESRDLFENKKKYDFINKVISLALILSALSIHLLIDLKDPLLPVVLLFSIPFSVLSFFTNKIEGILLQYRAVFFIYIFFISTTIYPYLFLTSLLLFIISKFYFFVKYDTKYPTFLNKYDISR